MAFDVGAGLSSLGGAVAATAGAMTLESQKAELEMDKVKLADQLAGAREEKGRAFTTSEREATQKFTGSENAANRTNAVQIANIGADAAVKSAGIHAGGAVAAAQIGANASLEGRRMEIAANKPLVDARVLADTIKNNSDLMVESARKQLEDARAAGDPSKIQQAQQKIYDATYSSDKQVQQVSLYQAQAKIAETALSQAQSRLAQMSSMDKAMMPENKAQIDQLTQQVKQLQGEYMSAVRTAQDALKNLPAYNPPSGPAAGTRPPLSSLIPGALPMPAVTGTTAPAPSPGSGLINQPTPGMSQ